MDRRRFLEIPVFGLSFLAAGRAFGNTRSNAAKLPVVVSTWDSGRTSNSAAWPILAKAGTSLDAVEAGGRASEDEPSCASASPPGPIATARLRLIPVL